MSAPVAPPYVVRANGGGRYVYTLAVDHGPHAHWPVASMVVRDSGVHVALSRSFGGVDSVSVTVRSEDDARELCETYAALMAKLASVEAAS